MNEGYEWYLKTKEKYASDNEAIVKEVNRHKDTPQNILWSKSISEKLENDDAKCVFKEDGFFFTEILVNKLMHFSYLQGTRGINEKSYQDGWNDCLDNVAQKLGLDTDA